MAKLRRKELQEFVKCLSTSISAFYTFKKRQMKKYPAI